MTTKTKILFFPAFAYVLMNLIACQPSTNKKAAITPPFNINEAKKQIEAQNQVFIAALAAGDSVGVANCYTTDAEFMPANEPLTKGRDQIVNKIGEYIRQGMIKYTITATTAWGDTSFVTVQEAFTLSDKNGNNKEIGKSIEMWKIEDGRYRLFRDCFNSDLPIPTTANK
jgi:uncharacterized protein (TIGR02246 family)